MARRDEQPAQDVQDDQGPVQQQPQPPVPAQPDSTQAGVDTQAQPEVPEPSGDPVEDDVQQEFVAPNGETVQLAGADGEARTDADGRPLYDWEVDPANQAGPAGRQQDEQDQ